MVESGQDVSLDEQVFASALEEFEKDSRKVIEGKIISIKKEDNVVLVDINQKSEARMDIGDIRDSDGNLTHNEGDLLEVVILSDNGERCSVSHKKAIKHKKIQDKIKSLGSDYKNIVIEAKIVKENKGGYLLEDDDGVEYFMPKNMSAITPSKDRRNSKNNGKRLKVCIVNVKPDEDSIVVSRKKYFDIDNKNKQENVQKILNADQPLEGIVRKITTFGMFVEVENVEGLVHYTEISYKGPVNPSKLYKEGDKVLVKAINFDKDKKRLSLSIKATTDDPWKEIENELEVGDAISVTVSNIESYGAFVDLGNDIEGFLHVSEISWDKNIQHPNEYLKNGQDIVVEVIEIDTKERRLRVSLKKLQETPFDSFCKTHKEGDTLTGTVATLTDFGAFVKVGIIDGLLHNEDAFWEKNMQCKDHMKEGDSLEVKIIKIDQQRERISLSRKLLLSSPAHLFAQNHKVDDRVKGVIRDIKDFGIFINIDKGVDALIKTEDLAPLNKDELKIGEEVEGVLSVIDPKNNKIRVSIKRLERKKEKESINAFNSNEKITLGDILKNSL